VADIDGLPGMPVANLRLTDVVGSGALGLTARFTEALELHQVKIKADQGPPISLN